MKRVLPLLVLFLSIAGFAQTTGAPLNLALPVQGSQGWGDKLNQNAVKINTFASTAATFPSSGTGITFYTSPTASRAATSSDIGSLFTGTSPCYLNKDGSCSAPPGLGVSSINGTTGAFTFNGSGVSCTTTTCTFSGGGGGGAFSAITNGTNTTAAMVVGTGATLGFSGSGVVNANQLNSVALASLATGILKNTTTTGVPSIAAAGTDYLAPAGSGAALTALNATQLTSGTVPVARLPIFGSGTAGAVPSSGGGTANFLRADGTWIAPAGTGTVTTSGSPTTGYVGLFTGASVIGNSHIDDGITTALTITSTEPIVVTGGSGNVIATNIIDGLTPILITTATTATLGGTYLTGYTINNVGGGTAATTYTLPTASAGKQYCAANYTGVTSALTFQTSAAGQFIDNSGVNTASGGFVTSGGALGDAACVAGLDGTHWKLFISGGTWTNH